MPYNEFSNKIAIWANRTKADMTRYIRNTYRGVAEEILTNSPCDTGLYLGSWTPSIDVPYQSNDFVPGPSKYRGGNRSSSKFLGSKESINRERALAHVRRKLDSVIPLITGNSIFYFSNGTRYAKYVEYGGGATPPYAVVRKATAKFRRILQQSATFGSGKWSNVGKGIIE